MKRQRRSMVEGRECAALSALHFSADGWQQEIVRLLLSHGADVDTVSHIGLIPMMIAASDIHAEIASLLSAAGADTAATVASVLETFNYAGRGVLSLAADSRIIALLEQARSA